MEPTKQYSIQLNLNCSSKEQQEEILEMFKKQFPKAEAQTQVIPPSSVPSVEEIEKKVKDMIGWMDSGDNAALSGGIMVYNALIGASTRGYSEDDMRDCWQFSARQTTAIVKNWNVDKLIMFEDYLKTLPSPPLDDMGKKPMGTDKWDKLNKKFDKAMENFDEWAEKYKDEQSESVAIEEVKGSDAVEFLKWFVKRGYTPSAVFEAYDSLYQIFLKDQSKQSNQTEK